LMKIQIFKRKLAPTKTKYDICWITS
jgi:hypothetical protein